MFTLDGSIKFVNVDTQYLNLLHQACPEVQYQPYNYTNKPYIGILLADNAHKYVIPLSSAKPKYTLCADIEQERFLIFELVSLNVLSERAIYKSNDNPTDSRVKHILSMLDVKKMIPVTDKVIRIVNLNYDPSDNDALKKYKSLLNKEYTFCIKIKHLILNAANTLYEEQITSGTVKKYCCDFRLLEQICDSYTTV